MGFAAGFMAGFFIGGGVGILGMAFWAIMRG